jgi:outer membrane protein assembly factor BamB
VHGFLPAGGRELRRALHEPGLLSAGAWPTVSRCASHQGRADVAGPAVLPTIAWAYPDPNQAMSQPAPSTGGVVIGLQDTVYFASDQGSIVALQSDGTLAWSQSFTEEYPVGTVIPARFTSTPTLGEDGLLYAVSQRQLYVLDTKQGGALQARKGFFHDHNPIDVTASPLLAPDGTVLIAFADGYLYAASAADHFAKWKWTGIWSEPISAQPALLQSLLYLVSDDGTMTVVDVQSDPTKPSKQWSLALSGELIGNPPLAPTLGADGSIYVARPGVNGVGGTLMQYNPDSTIRWYQPLSMDGLSASPAILPDGQLLITQKDGTLTLISPLDGATLAQFSGGGPLVNQPVVDSLGRIFVRNVADLDGNKNPVDNVRALDHTGQTLWSTHLGGQRSFAMAINSKGRLIALDERPDGPHLVALH